MEVGPGYTCIHDHTGINNSPSMNMKGHRGEMPNVMARQHSEQDSSHSSKFLATKPSNGDPNRMSHSSYRSEGQGAYAT